MKKTTTPKMRLLLAIVAILVSSCSTNATFSKRYHSRGFNIAWGGGSPSNSVKTNIRVDKHFPKQSELSIGAESDNAVVVNVPVSLKKSPIDVNHNQIVISEQEGLNCTVTRKQTGALSKKEIINERTKLNRRTNPTIVKKDNSKLNGDPESPIFGILSLVFGILGWVTLPLLFGLAAIVLGIIGLHRELNGLAIAGLVLGALILIIMVLFIAILFAM
jgi:hypothetical protein